MGREPTSTFGSIFKVEDLSEDPNLRVADKSWCWERGSEEEIPGERFFVHSSGQEIGRFVEVFRSSSKENGRWEGFVVLRA